MATVGGAAGVAAPHAVKALTKALAAFGRNRQWELAVDRLSTAVLGGEAVDAIVFSAAIGACARGHAPRAALALLRDAQARGLRPGVDAFSAAVTGHERARSWAQALALFWEMCRSGLQPDIVYRMREGGGLGGGGGALRRAARGLGAGERHRVQRDDQRLQQGPALGAAAWPSSRTPRAVRCGPMSFNAAASGCERGARWASALAVEEEMRQQNISPSIVTLNTLISACSKGSYWELSLGLLGEMHGRRLEPDAISFNCAIGAAEAGGQPQVAFGLLGRMRARWLRPDAVSWTSAIGACSSGHAWDSAVQLLSDLQSAELRPNELTYNATITACERAGIWDLTLALLEGMSQAGLVPSQDTHFIVLSALLGTGQAPRALEFYRAAVERGSVQPWHSEEPGVLDFHKFPAEAAKVAVRAALLDALAAGELGRMTFVVGRGKHSEGDPVLRGAVQEVLRGEFGLECRVDYSNPGRIHTTGKRLLRLLPERPRVLRRRGACAHAHAHTDDGA
eukprot:CAMPEP_0177290022 /NCGR_PEP_ID=MMETSP0367-20130122/75523_1 /TAXON_ID=447022 ORGANISM="Scrippsiella hangoei-like, Strain SHHI-4" /NCGR_SAMPLE_ID=MMETSP0367 /ASSEMBLY_ACC=CAM_ASM_000362 /LENGTH=509 /DNA_ID=CAMNT_0018747485 /DNA_START=193 /DNA_END=1717 /DNA_ORIENTATION=+